MATAQSGTNAAQKGFPNAPIFDGRKAEELRTWIIQLSNKLAAQPHGYPDDQACLRCAVNRLSGVALNLIRAYVSENTGRIWLSTLIRKKNLRPDAPGAQDALDAPWQGTYHSQRETHRQCKFGRSTPWHRVFGRRIPGRRASDTARRGTVHSDAVYQGTVRPDAARHGICLPDRACQGIFLLDAAVSGHFPSGRSRVRAFSFWTQPCQGK